MTEQKVECACSLCKNPGAGIWTGIFKNPKDYTQEDRDVTTRIYIETCKVQRAEYLQFCKDNDKEPITFDRSKNP